MRCRAAISFAESYELFSPKKSYTPFSDTLTPKMLSQNVEAVPIRNSFRCGCGAEMEPEVGTTS